MVYLARRKWLLGSGIWARSGSESFPKLFHHTKGTRLSFKKVGARVANFASIKNR